MSVDLSGEQLNELADAIAERLAAKAAGELITADELARRLNLSREFVYAHSASFGAIRFSGGERPRLWFRWPQALDRLADLEAKPPRKPPRAAKTNRQRRERGKTATVELLPIREPMRGRKPGR